MLKEFFVNEYPKFLYKPFGLIHNIFTITTLILLVIIYIKRNAISNYKNNIIILKVSSYILLINMIIYTIGNIYYGSFNYKENLPLHLCFIANYIFIYSILFNKYSILKYNLFISFIGPTAAILWPDLVSTIDNYNFWQLIISHHFFLNVSLFSYYALNYKITKIDYLKTFILLNVLMFCAYPFNNLFNTNYIFTSYIPGNVVKLYPWILKFPNLLVLEVLGLIISFLIYRIIVIPRNKELEKINNRAN